MKFKDWPYRLRGPQDEFFTTLALLVFADPGGGSFVAPTFMGSYPSGGNNDFVNFTAVIKASRIEVTLPLLAIGRKNSENDVGKWLDRYHHALQKERGITIKPSKDLCQVRVHYTRDGSKEYYVWYAGTNSDDVPLMHLPNGEMFATEKY